MTVMPGNTPRPSGAWIRPSVTRLCALTRVMSLAVEPHRARRQRPQPRDRPHHRGLARAVGAEQGDQLALAHHQRDAVQRLDPAVVHDDVADLEQDGPFVGVTRVRHRAPPGRRR